MKMANTKKFINLINEINEFLNERHRLEKNTTFGQAIIKTEHINVVVKRYFKELELYNDLRNFIVHTPYGKGTLAEPSSEVIENLDKILKALKAPKNIGKYVKNTVMCFDMDDSLSKVLSVVEKTGYSFFPIFTKNELVGLLTSNGISKGLAKFVKEDIISLRELSVAQIIEDDENIQNYKCISPNENVFNVIEMFENNANKSSMPVTLLISSGNIKRQEHIQGIITYWDLEKLRKDIE